MPPKGRRSKALVKGSSSRTPKSVRDENLPINPPIQTPNIPKAPTKTSIDGIHFNAFPKKSCRDLYTKVYRQRSFILERQLHLELFLNIPIPTLFAELGWLHWDCICSHCPYVLFEYYWVWLWIFDMLIMITFLCIYGYLKWFWTHECILTIFRQVIFVDICGYLCVNSFETCGSVLVICAGATNVFPKIYLQIL